jgi:leucyl-tRNA synthetase
MSTKRRDALMAVQDAAQASWAASSMFEEDAPDMPDDAEKFMCTFPYPYSNGKLHLGHAFTISKAEFASAYKRLTGARCLFPFGFHTTGMPIMACANKLKSEIERYGNPPVFPDEDEASETDISVAADAASANADPASADAKKGKATKGKVASKASRFKFQWEILRESGVPEDTIARFSDPLVWLDYFPVEGVTDLKRFGLKADWRRSFVTTDVNPYYDSFIRWQFNKLRSLNKVKFGKRYAVYSTVDNQACADHDRSAGEGVMPQEYTLIKMKLQALPTSSPLPADRDVYLPAATLRAETMYGQTNCWVLPTGEYGAYETVSGDIFITSAHSISNMAYQDILPTYGVVPEPLAVFQGSDLIGLPISSPHAIYESIYVLPLLTVSMTKGTGVVTSVPSDAPDDYRGLMDLKEKPALRAKFDVHDEWVMPFEPIPIIETPGFGNLAAVDACIRHKIVSQNDKEALAKAKEEVYKAGFYSGTMLVGSMAGESVQTAKARIREELIASKQAMSYSEPEGKVIDRNGVDCIVALCDQWYLEYGEAEWRAKAETCLAGMELYADETRKAFVSVLDWLKEWACSRSFGLGTKLPWDSTWLIESLSDSTIYMAYYTVAHLLQGGVENLKGQATGPSGLTPEEMTDEAWNYVILGSSGDKELPKVDVLTKLRKEFMYWYPVDLRVSGKDLIGNHLSFFIYNHVAIFGSEHWPKGIRSNGHVTLNAEKMSKSTGNFVTLDQAIELYTSDAVRFALADAGDTTEDANFSTKTADDAVLKLSTLVDFVEEGVKMVDEMRTGELTRFHDRVFASRINDRTRASQAAFERMLFRDALKIGFFEFVKDLGRYREAVGADKTSSTFVNMHHDLFVRYVECQVLVLAPICPHVSEHLWTLIASLVSAMDGNARPASVMRARWPKTEEPDVGLLASDDYLSDVLSRARATLSKPVAKKKKGKESGLDPSTRRDTVTIYVCDETPEWQSISLGVLRERFDADAWQASRDARPYDSSKWWKFPADTPKFVTASLPAALKKNKKVMPFVAKIRADVEAVGAAALDQALPFDESAVLLDNIEFCREALKPFKITSVLVKGGSEGQAESTPGLPGLGYTSSAAPSGSVEA